MENEFYYKNDLSTHCLVNMCCQQITLIPFLIFGLSLQFIFLWIWQGYLLIFKIIQTLKF